LTATSVLKIKRNYFRTTFVRRIIGRRKQQTELLKVISVEDNNKNSFILYFGSNDGKGHVGIWITLIF
jgi:hypothetical protein